MCQTETPVFFSSLLLLMLFFVCPVGIRKHANVKTKTALIYVFSGTEPTPSTKRATEGPTGRTTKEAPCKPLDTTVPPTTFPSDDRIPIQCDVAIVGGGTFSFQELLRRKIFERRTSSYHYTGDKINETAAVVVYTSTQWPFFVIAVFTGLLT